MRSSSAIRPSLVRCARRWLPLLLLGLASCSSPEPKPAPAQKPRPQPAPQLPEGQESASARVDRLCRSLTRIVASEIRGFADLRGEPVDDRMWQGREVPPQMYSCAVEGSYYPGAEYVCRGAQSWRGRPDMLDSTFNQLTGDLDACFGRRGWGERGWSRGQAFEFAAGERQILWRNGGNVQRPGLSLKIEEEIGRNVWFVRMAVMTLR